MIPNQIRIPLSILLKRLQFSVGIKWMNRLGTPEVITVKINKDKQFTMKGTNLSLENRLYWLGFEKGHEPMTSKTFVQCAIEADWVIDVGANSGFFSLIAKTMNPDAKLAAFEPHPYFYKLLEENAALNHFRIFCVNEAASDISGQLPFYFPRKNKGNVYSGSVSMSHYRNHQNTQPETIQIGTNPLDPFISKKGWTKGGLIKIDAEGHDEEVLIGLKETILNYLPTIIIEIQSEEKAKSIAAHDFLKAYEFRGIHDKGSFVTEPLEIPYYKGCDNYLWIPKQS